MPQLTKEDLLIFALEKGKAHFGDFEIFCKNKPELNEDSLLPHSTMSNYLKELVNQGFLEKGIEKNGRWPYYYVPENKRDEVEKLKNKKRSDNFIDSANEEEITRLMQYIDYLESREWMAEAYEEEHPLVIQPLNSEGKIESDKVALGYKDANKYDHLLVDDEKLAQKLKEGWEIFGSAQGKNLIRKLRRNN